MSVRTTYTDTAGREHPAEVAAVIRPGMGGFEIVGADPSRSRETRDRIRAAILNSNGRWLAGSVLVAIDGHETASTHKPWPHLEHDLPIALAILAAAGAVPAAAVELHSWRGALNLDGRLLHSRYRLADIVAGLNSTHPAWT